MTSLCPLCKNIYDSAGEICQLDHKITAAVITADTITVCYECGEFLLFNENLLLHSSHQPQVKSPT